jgi:general secretion pathway protein J
MKTKQDSRPPGLATSPKDPVEWNQGAGKTPDPSGFTLLELIISFTILGLILLIIGSSLRLGINAWDRGERIVDESQRARVLWERLSQDIRSTYPYQIGKDGGKRIIFEGRSDFLNFVTTTEGIGVGGGFKSVSYYIRNEGLIVKEQSVPDKELDKSKGKETILEPGVKEINFEFYEKKHESWETSWDIKEKERLPDIIKVIITFKQETPFPPLLISLPVAYNPGEGR